MDDLPKHKELWLEQMIKEHFEGNAKEQSLKIFAQAQKRLRRQKMIFAMSIAASLLVLCTLIVKGTFYKENNFIKGPLAVFDSTQKRFIAIKKNRFGHIANIGSSNANIQHANKTIQLAPQAKITQTKDSFFWHHGKGQIATTKSMFIKTPVADLKLQNGKIDINVLYKQEINMKQQLATFTILLMVHALSGQSWVNVKGHFSQKISGTYELERKVTVVKITKETSLMYLSLKKNGNWFHMPPKRFNIGDILEFRGKVLGYGDINWETGYQIAKISKQKIQLTYVKYPDMQFNIKLTVQKQEQQIPKDWLKVELPKIHPPSSVKKHRFIVINPSKTPIYNAKVVWTLPKGLKYVSANRNILTDGNKLTTTIATLHPGDSIFIDLKVKAAKREKSTGQVTLKFADREITKPWAIFIRHVFGIHISSYDTEDPVEVGRETIYVVTIRNEGSGPLTKIKFKNEVSKKMLFLYAEPKIMDIREKSLVFPTIDILKSGEKRVYRIRCRALQEGSARNRASLSYQEFGKPIIDEEGTSIYK